MSTPRGGTLCEKPDPRMWPANGRVALETLRGHIEGVRFTAGTARQITAPLADLLAAPEGTRERQLLVGQEVLCLEEQDGWAFVQNARDGYVGYVAATQLGDVTPATHWIAARASHAYDRPDFKTRERAALSHGARLALRHDDGTERFAATNHGYVPRAHLRPIADYETDPAAVAERLLGTPYLWGGNSSYGIDCSGLVQAAFGACGIAAPADSDMQAESFGAAIQIGSAPQRNDVLFWKGHVAIALGDGRIIHANAHDMAVAYEHLPEAIARIKAQDGGPIIAHRRA
ncbi:hypothetical protein A9Q95_12920 [Rhodobacterales bacterium 59_46_T64]|nr:hypothetical protein A9Q95_12920 [Rhodobacterales bacterium 59_46_T64]